MFSLAFWIIYWGSNGEIGEIRSKKYVVILVTLVGNLSSVVMIKNCLE